MITSPQRSRQFGFAREGEAVDGGGDKHRKEMNRNTDFTFISSIFRVVFDFS